MTSNFSKSPTKFGFQTVICPDILDVSIENSWVLHHSHFWTFEKPQQVRTRTCQFSDQELSHLICDHPPSAKMPPKKQPPQKEGGGKKPSATKIVEDRTFGMKNKKGAQMQRQIAQMTQSAKAGGTPEEKKKAAEKAQREKEKAASEAAAKEAAELFKPVQVQKVPFGVDPKTVLCQFYKKGHCEKGRKCKFSHDLNIERKAQKKDLYQDTREEEEDIKKKETSDDWDEEKLRSVVLSKKGNQKTTTDKVCKFFIDAVEEGKYGWFWTCPNGGDKCMYQHKLPPGYVTLNLHSLIIINTALDLF
jgi:hypothetical protein